MHRASNALNDAAAGQLVTLRFGPFELDTRSGELRRNGTTVRLQPQPFKVLMLLAVRPGELVTREEIQV
jgi:DNA-binding winged helix-turn-helix (wHTH) protein